MIDEKAHRRPGWSERSAVDPIVLGDGQTWLFPKPVAAVPSSAGGWMPSAATAADPEFDAILARLSDSDPLAPFEAAVYLLNLAYSLPDDAYPVLLAYRHDDDENGAMWSAILDVAQGHGEPTASLWARAARILASGPRGPMLLEEVNACVVLSVKAGQVLPASKYVQTLIAGAEIDQALGIAGRF